MGFKNLYHRIVNNDQVAPLIVLYSILAILLVLFRMKAVELDYKTAELKKEIQKIQKDTKELNAIKANLLSFKSLNQMAIDHKLKRPTQDQIIVVK